MKKLLSLLIVLVMVIALLTGCGGQAATGTDLAKLMLANQRLNAQLLKNDGDIFQSGAQTLTTLANQVRASLPTASNAPRLFASTQTGFGTTNKTGGKVVVDGTAFTWSDFEENSNSVSYMQSYADGIITTAERGAEMIDLFKQKVAIVDQWVRVGGSRLLLHVEENSETLMDRSGDQVDICKRVRDKQGNDVYEMYIGNDLAQTRMTYIKGKLLEHSIKFSATNDVSTIVANCDKGYWEVGTFDYVADRGEYADVPDGYNVSFTIMKDNLAYHFGGTDGSEPNQERNEGSIILDIISSDKKTDIMHVSDFGDDSATFSLKFSGFDGIANVTTTVEADQIGNDPASVNPNDKVRMFTYNDGSFIAILDNSDGAVINLTNGNQIRSNTKYLQEKVTVGDFAITCTTDGYLGHIDVRVSGQTYQQRVATLKQFLQQVGLQCRRNIDQVFDAVQVAGAESKFVQNNFHWNGYAVADRRGLDNARDVVLAEFDEYNGLYQQFKDAPEVSKNAYKSNLSNVDFAPVTLTCSDVTVDKEWVTISSVSLQTESSPLIVAGQSYQVRAGFVKADGTDGIVHVNINNGAAVEATGDSVNVGVNNLSFAVPTLLPGSYHVVVYVCTSDGIRVSQYVPVKITHATNADVTIGNVQRTVDTASEYGTINFQLTDEVQFSFSFDSSLTYDEFYQLIVDQVYNVCTLDTTVEKLVDGSYQVVQSTQKIGVGQYRIAYWVNNGEHSKQGYVQITMY
ncbi:MAG: hypothetical protein IKC47_04850 [Clostridia bacterium]|nr:hypothetical protein [Clostridia bacterium]